MDAQQLINSLRSELPPIFTRRTASRMTGGYIAKGTLANLDSRGEGPGGVLAKNAVIYEREAFLGWLEQRIIGGATKAPRKQVVGARHA